MSSRADPQRSPAVAHPQILIATRPGQHCDVVLLGLYDGILSPTPHRRPWGWQIAAVWAQSINVTLVGEWSKRMGCGVDAHTSTSAAEPASIVEEQVVQVPASKQSRSFDVTSNRSRPASGAAQVILCQLFNRNLVVRDGSFLISKVLLAKGELKEWTSSYAYAM